MSGRLDTLTNQVQMRLDTLNNIQKDWESMPLEQKRGAMSRYRRELNTIQNNITEMERLIQIMPVREREFFAADLAQCRDDYRNKSDALPSYQEELERLIQEDEEKRLNGVDEDLALQDLEKAQGALADLQQATKIGQEVLDTQDHIASTLADDRGRLKNVDNNLDAIDNEAEKGFKRGSRMYKRQILITTCIWFLVVIFAGFAALGVWFWGKKKGFWSKSNKSTESTEDNTTTTAVLLNFIQKTLNLVQ